MKMEVPGKLMGYRKEWEMDVTRSYVNGTVMFLALHDA